MRLEKSQTIVKQLNSQSGESIIPLFSLTPPVVNQFNQIITEGIIIHSLRLIARINSLPAFTPPEFSLEDTELDRLYKTIDIQWMSPRKQMDFYLSDSEDNWVKTGVLSLLNPNGYPYLTYDLLDMYTGKSQLELGEGSRLGVQINNVGYGVFASSDTATIFGNLTTKYTFI